MPKSRNRKKKISRAERDRRAGQINQPEWKSHRSLRQEIADTQLAMTAAMKAGQKAYATLLAVLAQNGDVTVTKGTIEQVEANFMNLTYEMSKGETEGEFVVKLVEKPEETLADDGKTLAEDTPDLEIRHVTDETGVQDDLRDGVEAGS